jgi:PAS domain S-box-containing protein
MSEVVFEFAQRIHQLEQHNSQLKQALEQAQVERIRLEQALAKDKISLAQLRQELTASQRLAQNREQDFAATLTNLQNAQAALADSEQLLQLVMDNIPQIIVWKDRNSVYLGGNRRAAEITGHTSPKEMVGKTDYDMPWTLEQSEWYRECDRRVMETGQAELHIIEPQQQAGGRQAWLDTNKIPLRDANGKVVGVLVTIEDITERKQSEIALQQLNEELEQRAEQRTTELQRVIAELEAEIRDRKQTEVDLYASQQLLQLVMDTIPQTVFWKDRNSVYLGCDRKFAKAAGVANPQAIIGRTDYDLAWKPEEADLYRKNDRQVMETGIPSCHLIEPQLQSDGHEIICDVSKLPLHDADGQVIGIVGIFEDVTERKRAEIALAASEAKFRRLVECANDLIWETQPDGSLTYLSPGFTKMFGYEISEWLHQPFAPLVHPDDLLEVFTEFQKMFETGQPVTGLEFRHRKKDGSWMWVTVNTTLIKDDTEQIIGVQGIIRDISDRKRQEQALHLIMEGTAATTGQEFFRSCARYLAEVLQAPYVLINQLSPDHQTAKTLAFWMGEEFGENFEYSLLGTPCHVAIQTGLVKYSHSVQAQFPEDSDLTTLQAESYLGTAVVDGDSNLLGNIAVLDTKPMFHYSPAEEAIVKIFATRVATEIERQEAEQQLQDRAQELNQALQRLQSTQAQMVQAEKMSSLGQLVAGIAHEINNPVNFIHGNLSHAQTYTQDLLHLVQLYQKHYPNPVDGIQTEIEAIDLEFLQNDLPQLLTSMRTGTDRIREIVLSLRNFSRLDESEMKTVDIHEGIDSTLMILQHRLKAKANFGGIQIIKQYGNLPLVECYVGQLNQVFMNIMTNAIDALEEKCQSEIENSQVQNQSSPLFRPTITIRTQVQANQVQIQIADNGFGIPEAIQQRIFDPFFTTKPVGKGTGMGMSISYQIVTEKHGGVLSCQSTQEQGTEFTIEIPVKRSGNGLSQLSNP